MVIVIGHGAVFLCYTLVPGMEAEAGAEDESCEDQEVFRAKIVRYLREFGG